MRVFQVLDEATNTSVPGSSTWYKNLHEPLRELGCDVVFESATRGRLARQRNDPRLRERFTNHLSEVFRREHLRKPFDLFFAYLTEGMVEPWLVDDIRNAGVLTCNFSCNSIHQFHLVAKLASRFDYCLHSEKDAREKYLAAGANPIWWPMAANPRYFYPQPAERIYDVTFLGGCYGLRSRYVYQLLDRGIDIHAFGPGWRRGGRTETRARLKRALMVLRVVGALAPLERAQASGALAEFDLARYIASRFPGNVHEPISDEKAMRLYSESKISLGVLEVWDRNDASQPIRRHVHLREFEAPMCGALYCTGFSEELEEFFEPDREVVMYTNDEELADKIHFYLQNPKAADTIRQAGLRRARAEHTYQARFRKLFAELRLAT